jgi:hypothetical protein
LRIPCSSGLYHGFFTQCQQIADSKELRNWLCFDDFRAEAKTINSSEDGAALDLAAVGQGGLTLRARASPA